jgi:hypothetical protein
MNLTVKICLFQTCPDSFSLDCNEKEENTPKEMQQPSFSRDLEFFLNITSLNHTRSCRMKLSDLIRDIELLKNKAELLSSRLQQWNLLDDTVSDSILLVPKKILSSSS